MQLNKIELKKLADKILSALTKRFKDPEIIGYNFYDNASGVGVKMARTKMTIEDLKTSIEDLAAVVTAGFAKQEVFNQEVRNFMVKQEEFNQRIEHDIKEIKSCPTIAQEIAEMNSKQK